MAHELSEIGVEVERKPKLNHADEDASILPEEHHRIAADQRNVVDIASWLRENRGDPATTACLPHRLFQDIYLH